jgi:hypothetical protein
MDGDLPVRFEVRTPPETISRANMAVSEQSGLPEAVPLRTAIIVANGPSALSAELWDRPARDDPGLITVALNGALRQFLNRGLMPTYWCACDPQALVADFLPADPPRKVTYLVASKCHEAVFAKLRGRDVRIWRLDDFGRESGRLYVPCAVSITLVAQGLFRLLGYHRFEMYGWDGCYIDGRDHASAQPHSPEHDQRVSLVNAAGDIVQTYSTTGSWMAEAHDAAIQAANFRAMGLEMVVHGPGMIGAILRGRGLI